MKILVEIAKNSNKWNDKNYINEDFLSEITRNILICYPNLSIVKNIELSILLTDNLEMQYLNHKFRKIDKPTDVLSFPDVEYKNILEFSPNLGYMYLGDIALCYEQIDIKSQKRNMNFKDYFICIFVHSVLHLLGYDHDSDSNALKMEKMELNILSSMNLKPLTCK